jgi:hypothetical protein
VSFDIKTPPYADILVGEPKIFYPYGIVYQIRVDMIVVVAIMHLHREPTYWKSRITKNI